MKSKVSRNLLIKFKVGDWIIDNNVKTPFLITDISNEKYDVISIYGSDMAFSFHEVERFYHLWTIQDAKDGDVLFIGIDGSPCIFKKLEGDLLYSYIISDGKLLVEDSHYYYETSDNVYPATKEQREQLEKAMVNAGYKWDADKKGLKKI